MHDKEKDESITTYDLKEHSPARLFARLHHRCATGEVQLPGRGSTPLRMWLRNGQLVAILADNPERRWAQWLLQKNLVPPWALDLALTQVRIDRPIGQVLTRMGLIGAEEFKTYFSEWLYSLLLEMMRRTDGTATFNPDAEIPLFPSPDIPFGNWIAQAIRDLPDDYPFMNYLPGDRFIINEFGDEHLVNVRIYKAEKIFFESLAEGRSIHEIARSFHVSPAVVTRAAFLFYTLNWLKPAPDDFEQTQPFSLEKILSSTAVLSPVSPENLPSRETILNMAKTMAQKDPFHRLELEPGAPRESIYKAYFERVRLFHPDVVARHHGEDTELIHAVLQLRHLWREAFDVLVRQREEKPATPTPAREESERMAEDAQRAYSAYVEARQHLSAGRHRDAVRALERAIRYKENEALYWERLGDALIELKEWKRAERAYRRAWELQPYNIDIPISLARLYWQFNKPALAARWAREALGIDPDNHQVQNLIRMLEDAHATRKKGRSLWKRIFGKS